MRRIGWLLFACCTVAWAPVARAQVVVTGLIRDEANKEPVSGATTIIRAANDSIVASSVTNAAGQFRMTFTPLAPGLYAIAARRMGYDPRAADSIEARTVDSITVTIDMPRLAVMLDTVQTNGEQNHSLFKLTPGRDLFTAHYREGKGVFFSGKEIQWSGLGACGYFSKVPGLRLAPWGPGIPCDPGPRPAHFVASATQPACLFGWVDRMGPIAGLNTDNEIHAKMHFNLPPPPGPPLQPMRIPLSDVVGVEVYQNRSDLPADMIRDLDIPPKFNCAVVRVWTTQAW